MSKFEQTKYITGLRAFAALAVFLIHSGGAGLVEFSKFTSNIVFFGKYGVTAFFVLSAFTICMSIDKVGKFDYKNYLFRRYLRIAPLYYIVILFCFFAGGSLYYQEYFNVNNDIKSLLLHLTFLNLFDIRHMNNIIGVEWSIPIEFFFYLIIPYVFFFVNTNTKRSLDVLLISLIIYLLTPIYLVDYLKIHWSVFYHSFSFSTGILVYILMKKFNFFKHTGFNSFHLILHFTLLLVFIYLQLPFQDLFVAIWVGILIILLGSKPKLGLTIFENKTSQFLGKISFSFYLVHYPIIELMPDSLSKFNLFIMSFFLTLIISTLTYYFIEEPFIKMGKIQKSVNKKTSIAENIKQIS